MPFTQKALLIFSMPDNRYDPQEQLCKEIVYELMLEPWVLQSLQCYMERVSPSPQFAWQVVNLTKMVFTCYQHTDAFREQQSPEILAFLQQSEHWLNTYCE